MVDPAGKFIRDDDDVIVFNFGKHRGNPINEHLDYLDWMTRQGFPGSTMKVVNAVFDRLRDEREIMETELAQRAEQDDIPFS